MSQIASEICHVQSTLACQSLRSFTCWPTWLTLSSFLAMRCDRVWPLRWWVDENFQVKIIFLIEYQIIYFLYTDIRRQNFRLFQLAHSNFRRTQHFWRCERHRFHISATLCNWSRRRSFTVIFCTSARRQTNANSISGLHLPDITGDGDVWQCIWACKLFQSSTLALDCSVRGRTDLLAIYTTGNSSTHQS